MSIEHPSIRIERPTERITLLLGDCQDALRLIACDLQAPVLLATDPPYGVGLVYSRRDDGAAIANDHNTDARDWALAEIPHAAAIVFGSPKVEPPPGALATLIWNKGEHVGMGDLDLPWKPCHEEIYILGDAAVFAGRRDPSVLNSFPALYPNLPSVNAAKDETIAHPTQKPVALMSYLLGKAPHARTVIDPFMGSGSTGVAAARRGQAFIGIECVREHFETALARITEAARQGDMFMPNAGAAEQIRLFPRGKRRAGA